MAALFNRMLSLLRYGASGRTDGVRLPALSRKHKQPTQPVQPLDRAREQHRILSRHAERCDEPQLASRLTRMGMMADAVIRETSRKPGLLPVVHRFYAFDLPLTVALLERYERLMRSDYYSKEMEYRAKRIEQLIATLARRYVRCLNRLIQADMVQMDMELSAYERMLKQGDVQTR